MWFRTLFESLKLRSALAPTRQAGRDDRRRGATVRLRVEPLEDRCLLSFAPAMSYPVGQSPQAVVTADFNNDGRIDLAVAAQAPTVSILLGRGDGSFQAAPTFGAGTAVRSLAVADFNADGRLDLASNVGVFLGNGDGTFGAALDLGSVADAVAAGDLNGDNKTDLVVAFGMTLNGEDSLGFTNVLLGNGDGTFAPPLTTAAGVFPTSVALADVNGDGRQDVVTTENYYFSSTALVLLGNGDGTLQPAAGFPTVDGVSGYVSIAVADFNGDGKPDLASATVGNLVSILPGNGDGTFGAAQNFFAGEGGGRTLAVADFNGDGKLDLATASPAWGGTAVSVLLGNGDGTLRPPTLYPTGWGPWAVATADFNGDGRPDLAVANTISDNVSILINDANWPPPGAPSIAVSDAVVSEGHSGTRAITFTVSLSAAFGQAVTVAYATADDTATVAGGDYRALSGTLTFAAGETSKMITVLVNGDRLGEPDETFVVNLGTPTNATIADGQGVATILDDEPRISINDVTRAEGKTGQTTLFTFTVTLSAAYDQAVTTSFRTVAGSAATNGGDYVARTGTLTFAPGETTRTITIAVQGDSKREANETFYLDLFGNSGNSLFAENRGIGTILNDD